MMPHPMDKLILAIADVQDKQILSTMATALQGSDQSVRAGMQIMHTGMRSLHLGNLMDRSLVEAQIMR